MSMVVPTIQSTSEVEAHASVTSLVMGQARCFTSVRLLCQAARAVQRHRGATMAYTSGEAAFLDQARQMQVRINNLITVLNSLAGEIDAFPGLDPIAASLLEKIRHDWYTILVGWRDDRIMRNFEFHGHLIETINRAIVAGIEQPLESAPGRAATLCSLGCKPGVAGSVNGIFAALLDFIESLAMLRGLSTSASVIEACGADSHARLLFMLKEIPTKSQSLIAVLKGVEQYPEAQSGLGFVRKQQAPMHRFLISIEMAVLGQRGIATDSQVLFRLGTEIIDAHWRAFDAGIDLLERSLLCRAIDQRYDAAAESGVGINPPSSAQQFVTLRPDP